MKNNILLFTLLPLAVVSFSCTKNETTSTFDINQVKQFDKLQEDDMDIINLNTISKRDFETWTDSWKKNGKSWMNDNDIHSFYMPITDLKNVVNMRADESHFYLGLMDDGNGSQEIKLIVVGMKNGKDMLDYENEEYAYDYTNACPPFCKDTLKTN